MGYVVCRHGSAFKVHIIWYMYLRFEHTFLGNPKKINKNIN
jgi:hypothetical protein